MTPWGLAGILAAAGVLLYAASLWLAPARRCRWCNGGCRMCDQTGRRLRLGARVAGKAASWWRGRDRRK